MVTKWEPIAIMVSLINGGMVTLLINSKDSPSKGGKCHSNFYGNQDTNLEFECKKDINGELNVRTGVMNVGVQNQKHLKICTNLLNKKVENVCQENLLMSRLILLAMQQKTY